MRENAGQQGKILVEVFIGQRPGDGQWLVSLALQTKTRHGSWASAITEEEASVLSEVFVEGGVMALLLYLKERWRGSGVNLKDLGLD